MVLKTFKIGLRTMGDVLVVLAASLSRRLRLPLGSGKVHLLIALTLAALTMILYIRIAAHIVRAAAGYLDDLCQDGYPRS